MCVGDHNKQEREGIGKRKEYSNKHSPLSKKPSRRIAAPVICHTTRHRFVSHAVLGIHAIGGGIFFFLLSLKGDKYLDILHVTLF